MDHRHGHLLPADLVHLLPHDVLDLGKRSFRQGQVGKKALAELPDEAGPKEQLMAYRVRPGGWLT
jgi:hypothetical protein